MPGSRTLDSVPDEDDGDDDSEAESRVKSTAVIIGFFAPFLAIEFFLFESFIQPLAVIIDPAFAGDPRVDYGGQTVDIKNRPGSLKFYSIMIFTFLGMLTSLPITDKLLGDRLTDD
jgi:hypothetical protein